MGPPYLDMKPLEKTRWHVRRWQHFVRSPTVLPGAKTQKAHLKYRHLNSHTCSLAIVHTPQKIISLQS